MKDIPVEKIGGREKPVPMAWRSALQQLADKAVLGTELETLSNIETGLIDSKTELSHHYNIDGYPDKLGSLHERSWETSVYIWDAPCWRVLVDLTDIEGNVTDLVLHAKIYETDKGFLVEPGLIYVP